MSETPLRRVLLADGAVGLAVSAAMLLATSSYAHLTGLSESFLRWAAVILLGYVLVLTLAALLRPLRRTLVVSAIVANAAWVAASLVVFALVPTTLLGGVYVIGQALIVVGFAIAEAVTLRRVQD